MPNLMDLYAAGQSGSVLGSRPGRRNTLTDQSAGMTGGAPVQAGSPMPHKMNLDRPGGGGAWMKDASTGLKAAKLGHSIYGLASGAEAAAPVVYGSATEAAMAPVSTELMSSIMGYAAPEAVFGTGAGVGAGAGTGAVVGTSTGVATGAAGGAAAGAAGGAGALSGSLGGVMAGAAAAMPYLGVAIAAAALISSLFMGDDEDEAPEFDTDAAQRGRFMEDTELMGMYEQDKPLKKFNPAELITTQDTGVYDSVESDKGRAPLRTLFSNTSPDAGLNLGNESLGTASQPKSLPDPTAVTQGQVGAVTQQDTPLAQVMRRPELHSSELPSDLELLMQQSAGVSNR